MKIINLNKSIVKNKEIKEIYRILSNSSWLKSAISITDFYETLIFSYDEKEIYISISIRNNLYFLSYQDDLNKENSISLNYMSFNEIRAQLENLKKRQAF